MAGSPSGTSYLLPEGLSFDQWQHSGDILQDIHANINWWIGDWLIYGEERFPDRYSQAIHLTGKSEVTLRNCAWVCSVYPPDERRWELSYTHYLELAGMRDIDQRNWLLDKAEQGDLSALEVRKLRADEVRSKPLAPLPQPKSHKITLEMQMAIESFTSQIVSCPLPEKQSEQEVSVEFPWGRLELGFVRESKR